MHYRKIGKTALEVSEIGLGCEGFLNKDDDFTNEMFALALEHGINCMDLYSPNPELHKRIGNIIHKQREKFIIQGHLCTIWQNEQYKATRNINEVKSAFEALLRNLNTDYIDIGMIHYVDSQKTWNQIANGEIMQHALELKKQGKIRYIGMSSHNPIVALEAVKSGLIEVLMFSVNACYDLLPGDEDCENLWAEESYKKPLFNIDPQREELYETCQRLEVGITVMKAGGGGDLLSEYSPAGKAMTPVQCIHYALTRPAVSTVFSGVHSIEDLKKSLHYEYASDNEKDYASVFAEFDNMTWQGHCMYCGHCAPCPKHIDVASVMKFLNLAKAQNGIPETVYEHYMALESKAGDCITCGVCEKRCPFGVSIIENMKEAKKLFEM